MSNEKSHVDDPDSPERVYERSFVGQPPKRIWVPMLLTSFVVFLGTIVLLHDSLPEWLNNAGVLLWSGVIGVWMVLISAWRTVFRVYVHSENAWQSALPFAFDRERYKETLSRRTIKACCVVIVDSGIKDVKTNETISIALAATDADKVIHLRDGIFEVRSKIFDTATDSEYDSVFTNVHLHRWFKHYAKNVLVPLHALGFVASVRVESRE